MGNPEHRLDRLERRANPPDHLTDMDRKLQAMSDEELIHEWHRARPPVPTYCEGCRVVTPHLRGRCVRCWGVPRARAMVVHWDQAIVGTHNRETLQRIGRYRSAAVQELEEGERLARLYDLSTLTQEKLSAMTDDEVLTFQQVQQARRGERAA